MPRVLKSLRTLAFGAVAMIASSSSADGVIEISQTSALAGGITSSDSPGFPVTLDSPGSYLLTSALTVSGSSSIDGIATSVVGVEINLNGFSITGPGVCTGIGASLTCPPIGSGAGVRGGSGTTVRNGTIRGFSNSGVFLGSGSHATNLILTENSASGIQVQGQSEISRCIVSRNAIGGIIAQHGSIVTRNVVHGNDGTGISAGAGGSVTENSIWANSGRGITIVSSVQDAGGIAARNAVLANGSDGLLIDTGSLVLANSIKDNGGNGIGVVVGAAYGHNNVRGNAGTITVTGGDIAPNVCEGNLTCP